MEGHRLVRLLHSVHRDCMRLIPKNRDRKKMRRHALKLRFWPEMHPETNLAMLLDLDWSWIQSCKSLNIGELRINEYIAGFDNWRVIFFEGPKAKKEELQKIWILQVMKKKSNDFSDGEIKTFKLRRLLVLNRYYGK